MKEIELEGHFYDSNHRVCVEYLIKQPTIGLNISIEQKHIVNTNLQTFQAVDKNER